MKSFEITAWAASTASSINLRHDVKKLFLSFTGISCSRISSTWRLMLAWRSRRQLRTGVSPSASCRTETWHTFCQRCTFPVTGNLIKEWKGKCVRKFISARLHCATSSIRDTDKSHNMISQTFPDHFPSYCLCTSAPKIYFHPPAKPSRRKLMQWWFFMLRAYTFPVYPCLCCASSFVCHFVITSRP